MKISIGSNLPSLNTQRWLQDASSSLGDVYQRLSSGTRINSASDDPAGLSVAEGLNVDNRVFTQAVRNVNEAVSAISVAEGAVNELTNIVIRQRELAEQAANGVNSDTQREALDTEAQALSAEYARILSSTEFNGRDLFDTSLGALGVQAGYGTIGNIEADFMNITQGESLEGLGTYTTLNRTFGGTGTLYANGIEFLKGDMDDDGLDDIVAIEVVDAGAQASFVFAVYLAEDGGNTFALDDTLSGKILYLGTAIFNVTWEAELSDYGSDGDLDILFNIDYEDNGFPGFPQNRNGVAENLTNGGAFNMASGFNAVPAVTPSDDTSLSLTGDFNNDGVSDTVGSSGQNVQINIQDTETVQGAFVGVDLSQESFSLATQSNAQSALTTLESQLELLTTTAGRVGAAQSRLSAASSVLGVSSENYATAESRIRDVDVADETARLAAYSIRTDVTTSVLAQANQQPELVLDLIRNA